MRRILLATDFSERSDNALHRACQIAQEIDAEITLVHVIDNDRPKRLVDAAEREASAMLDEATRSLPERYGIVPRHRIAYGMAHTGLLETARHVDPDLMVIGPHRRRPLRDVFVGTTAERTIRDSPCPVLMACTPPDGPYRNVLAAVDFSETSRSAVVAALKTGLAVPETLTVLHAYEQGVLPVLARTTMTQEEIAAFGADGEKAARKGIADLLHAVRASAAQRLVVPSDTTAAETILSAAKECGADLIAIGARGVSGLEKMVLGSVAETVLRRTDRDVLTVPLMRDAFGEDFVGETATDTGEEGRAEDGRAPDKS